MKCMAYNEISKYCSNKWMNDALKTFFKELGVEGIYIGKIFLTFILYFF